MQTGGFTDEHRCERKFAPGGRDLRTLWPYLADHPLRFAPLYKPRRIVSVYYDTPWGSGFDAHSEGVGRKLTTRVRWYAGARDGLLLPRDGTTVNLEFKLAAGDAQTKRILPLGVVAPQAMRRPWSLLPPGERSAWARAMTDGCEAVCAVQYVREYFLSSCRRFRVTIDRDIAATPFAALQAAALADRGCTWTPLLPALLVELKYGVAHETLRRNVTETWPWEMVRLSKFAAAMRALVAQGRIG